MANKMTKMEVFSAIANYARGNAMTYQNKSGDEVYVTKEELLAFVEAQMVQLEKTSAKASERAAKKRAESDEMTEAVSALLTNEPQTCEELTVLMGDESVTRGKVQARLTKLVNAGVAVKTTVKVDKRNLMAYALAE